MLRGHGSQRHDGIRLSNEQIAALAKATEGVRKDWTAKIGADLVKAAEEDMASVR